MDDNVLFQSLMSCEYFYYSSAGKIFLKEIQTISFLCVVIIITVNWSSLFSQNYYYICIVIVFIVIVSYSYHP